MEFVHLTLPLFQVNQLRPPALAQSISCDHHVTTVLPTILCCCSKPKMPPVLLRHDSAVKPLAVLGLELINKPLGVLRLLDDAFLVVLSDGAAQLVVVHGRTVLALAPQFGHATRVLNLEDPCNAHNRNSKIR